MSNSRLVAKANGGLSFALKLGLFSKIPSIGVSKLIVFSSFSVLGPPD
jgi:hypothetical protein